MDSTLGRSSGTWNSERGEYISEDHSILAEILEDYNRGFSLVYIPEKDRTPGDTKPFAILHTTPNSSYVVRFLSEQDMKDPQGVLAWVFENDTSRTDVLGKLEAADRARELFNLQRQEEAIAQSVDELRFLARTPLHTFTMDGRRYTK